MHHVLVSRKIQAPAEKVWQKLDKFRDVYTYHPLVKHSEGINEIPTGIGAERTCYFEDGNQIKERITAYEKSKNYQVEIYDPGAFPLLKAVALLEVKTIDEQSSSVDFNMEFQPRFGPIGWLMAQFIMKKQFAQILKRVLDGLDTHLQTGQVIGKNGLAQKTT
jgi:hypothetical protein